MKGRNKMQINVRWKIEVFDKERKSGKRELIHLQDEPGNSIIGNFISWVVLAFTEGEAAPLAVSIKDQSGTVNAEVSNLNVTRKLLAIATDANSGVRLGTGNTAVTVDDFDLAAPIAHGVGAGQLLYGISFAAVPLIGTNPRFFQIVRAFSNGPAGAVVCQEAGLSMSRPGAYYLIERSVISPFNIPALGAATATATLGVTV
jgi:hypothetical protein